MTTRRSPGSLLRRILEADPTLTVDEILVPSTRASIATLLPVGVRMAFLAMTLDWPEDREVWGRSFDLGRDTAIELGHFRGHHLATWPQAYGYTDAQAERVIRIEIEGVALHELGHALVGRGHEVRGLPWLEDVLARFREAVHHGGWPTGYAMGASGGRGDPHEGIAEAFRWWIAAPEPFKVERPDLAWVGPTLLEGLHETP